MADKKKNKSRTEFIEDSFYRIAVISRMMVDNGEFTEQEMRNFIAEKGNEQFNQIFGMSKGAFGLLLLKELMNIVVHDDYAGMT